MTVARPLLALSLAGLLFAACSSRQPSPSTTSQPNPTSSTSTTTSTPATSSTQAAPTTTSVPAMIKVDEPLAGASITSPFTLSGSANVYEAALNAELTSSDGSVLDSTAFHATAGTGTWGTFSTSITFPAGHAGAATLTVYSVSAKDGSRINQVVIPVNLR